MDTCTYIIVSTALPARTQTLWKIARPSVRTIRYCSVWRTFVGRNVQCSAFVCERALTTSPIASIIFLTPTATRVLVLVSTAATVRNGITCSLIVATTPILNVPAAPNTFMAIRTKNVPRKVPGNIPPRGSFFSSVPNIPAYYICCIGLF